MMDRETYDEATARISNLKERLPEYAVRSLAEEVLHRTALLSATRDDLRQQSLRKSKIDSLTSALLSSDPDAALNLIQSVQAEGTDLEEIYMGYLSAAAQQLGNMWQSDQVSLVQVTLGTSRIYGIMRALEPIRTAPEPSAERSAVFANVPGDQHVLGIRIAADLFRKRGWDIDLLIGLSHDEIVARVKDGAHMIIGLSAGSEQVIASMARLVLAIRLHKPSIRIFVGGQAVDQFPDLVAAMSPDGMSADFEETYEIMMDLWRQATAPAARDSY